MEARSEENEWITATRAAQLLGISYPAVLKYCHELEANGLIKVHRQGIKLLLSPEDIRHLRQHHETRPNARAFRRNSDREAIELLLKEVSSLESATSQIARRLSELSKKLRKAPTAVTIWLKSIPGPHLNLLQAIPVVVSWDGARYTALSPDIGSSAEGSSQMAAARALRKRLAEEFVYLCRSASSSDDEERLEELAKFIRFTPRRRDR